MSLFGGAITTSIPTTFRDASEIRQIPDSQEVYLSTVDDTSIIIEILELVKSSTLESLSLTEAIQFHYDSLAHDNEAFTSTVSSIILPPNTKMERAVGPTILFGYQTISKFNLPASQSDLVLICIALWRIPSKNSDLVVTINFPIRFGSNFEGPESKPRPTIERDVEGIDRIGESRTKELFESIVQNLIIRDFDLFAGGAEADD